MGLKKALRAQEIARENKAAADLAGGVGRRQPDVPGRDLRRRRAQLRQPGAPVGHGHPADRGGARLVHRRRRLPAGPVGLRGAGARALEHLPGRPPLVKAAIGEDATDEELGGADARQQSPAWANTWAENDAHAIASRELMDKLPWDAASAARSRRPPTPRNCWASCPPTNASPRHREVIARIVDGSGLSGVQARLRAGRVRPRPHRGPCGRRPRQQRPIQPEGSTKAAQFIQLRPGGTPWSSCRTPPATWWARRPSAAARRQARR